MKYVIVCNPHAGPKGLQEKIRILDKAAAMLDCKYYGLDTKSAEEFRKCIKKHSKYCDVLVVAGGDGTFLDAINHVDPEQILAYLPLGSGNVLRYNLKLPRSVIRNVEIIKKGRVRCLDMILCDYKKKALFVNLGLSARLMHERHKYIENKKKALKGFSGYAIAVTKSLIKKRERADAEVDIDGEIISIPSMLMLTVTKLSNFAYGVKMVPNAKLDDGLIHLMSSSHRVIEAAYGYAKAHFVKNKMGLHRAGKIITIKTNKDQILSINGTPEKIGKKFRFEVLPGALKLIC